LPEDFTAEDVKAYYSKIGDFSKPCDYPIESSSGLEAMFAAEERSLSANKTNNSQVLKSDEIFHLIKNYLGSEEGKKLVQKTAAVFQFDITTKKGGEVVKTWTIDLKNSNGACKEGPPEAYDALFTMTDDDFQQVCLGNLNPQMAFVQGKMKIKGSMGKASKFTPDLFPKPTPENVAKYAKAKL
jgi:3-hydroxyacyl-CoA dehydrogenase/3a,7a,12a-trihydroxy-5b-cholest-24-enoyl-CoA hydratase